MPCPGEYNPTSRDIPGTASWPFGAKEETLEALSLALGGDPALPPLTDATCTPAIERFAEHVCTRLGPPPPPNCFEDILAISQQYYDRALEYRWLETATPDGVDLSLAGKIVLSWVLTLPFAGALAAVLTMVAWYFLYRRMNSGEERYAQPKRA